MRNPKYIIFSCLFICFAAAAVVFSAFMIIDLFFVPDTPDFSGSAERNGSVDPEDPHHESTESSETLHDHGSPAVSEDTGNAGTEPQNPDPDCKPMIALTFDDGPSENTGRLLDYFAEYGGKCTFFVVGNMIGYYRDVLKRAAEDGHEIGTHGWDHSYLTEKNKNEIAGQIEKTRKELYDTAGIDSTILRPPYGSVNDLLKETAAELGISLISWSVDSQDWMTRDEDAVYEKIMSDVKDGAIILCHDLHAATVDAMEKVIPDLIEKGYLLVTVTELLSSDDDDMVPGEVYYHK